MPLFSVQIVLSEEETVRHKFNGSLDVLLKEHFAKELVKELLKEDLIQIQKIQRIGTPYPKHQNNVLFTATIYVEKPNN